MRSGICAGTFFGQIEKWGAFLKSDIEQISEIEAIWIDNEKKREQEYKEVIKANNPEALVSIIYMIYQRKRMRLEQEKKVTVLI